MALLLSKLGCVAANLHGFNTAEKMLDLYHAVTSENIAIEEGTRVLPPVSKCKGISVNLNNLLCFCTRFPLQGMRSMCTRYTARDLRMEYHVIPAHLLPLIFKLCREQLSIIDPTEEDMIAFPQVQIM